jgi:hypothetical protein
MKMNIYNRNTLNSRCFLNKEPYIRFSISNTIHITGIGADVLKVSKGMSVEFIQDADRPKDWYVTNSANGFKLRQGKSCLCFNNKALAEKIRKSLNITGKFALKICKEPVMEGSYILHALLTSNPL